MVEYEKYRFFFFIFEIIRVKYEINKFIKL